MKTKLKFANSKVGITPLKLDHITFTKDANLGTIIKVLELMDLCVHGGTIEKAKKIVGVKVKKY